MNEKIQVSKGYLELARVNLNQLKPITKNLKELDSTTILFAFSSLVINYSYSAVEAFINNALYNSWKDSKALCEDGLIRNMYGYDNALLKSFYSKYKSLKEFKEF